MGAPRRAPHFLSRPGPLWRTVRDVGLLRFWGGQSQHAPLLGHVMSVHPLPHPTFAPPPGETFDRRSPADLSDRIAYGLTRALRLFADVFFQKRYGHRAVVLETVAAVPGMVAGMLNHLKSLRRMEPDRGWIKTLLDEAENERMHLMTFIAVARPNGFERALVILAQGVFFNLFFLLYLFAPRTAHRMVAYFEEEAVISYTQYLHEIDAGRLPNPPAPEIAISYWGLPVQARLRDVVVAVRRDEMGHRDVNHGFADALKSA